MQMSQTHRNPTWRKWVPSFPVAHSWFPSAPPLPTSPLHLPWQLRLQSHQMSSETVTPLVERQPASWLIPPSLEECASELRYETMEALRIEVSQQSWERHRLSSGRSWSLLRMFARKTGHPGKLSTTCIAVFWTIKYATPVCINWYACMSVWI